MKLQSNPTSLPLALVLIKRNLTTRHTAILLLTWMPWNLIAESKLRWLDALRDWTVGGWGVLNCILLSRLMILDTVLHGIKELLIVTRRVRSRERLSW